MKRIVVLAVVLLAVSAAPVFAQQFEREAEIKRAVPYTRMLRENPNLTLLEYNRTVRELAAEQLRNEQRTVTPRYEAPRRYVPDYAIPTYTPPRPVTPSVPQSRTTYDWETGNTYRTRKNVDGSAEVNGHNLNTGSTWRTTIKPDGSMRGTDSNFNTWTYDAKTKHYYNYGTGKTCTGEGASRVCW